MLAACIRVYVHCTWMNSHLKTVLTWESLATVKTPLVFDTLNVSSWSGAVLQGRRVGKARVWKRKAPDELVWIKVPSLHREVDRLPGADVECDGEAALLLLLHLEVQTAGAG